MDLPSKITALKADIKELEVKNKKLKEKNEKLEAENQGLWDELTEMVNPEERVDIRTHITANHSKIIANQGTITANTQLMTEYQRTINAAITATGTIHLRKLHYFIVVIVLPLFTVTFLSRSHHQTTFR